MMIYHVIDVNIDVWLIVGQPLVVLSQYTDIYTL